MQIKIKKLRNVGGQQDGSDGKGHHPQIHTLTQMQTCIHTYIHTTHIHMKEKNKTEIC